MLTRLLDSVILIDHLNDHAQATEFLLALNPGQTAISVITRAEILAGAETPDAIRIANALLDQYPLLIIDKADADKAAELRRSIHWKLPDAFQAALAIRHQVKLTTRNTKDFDPQRHAFVEVPYILH